MKCMKAVQRIASSELKFVKNYVITEKRRIKDEQRISSDLMEEMPEPMEQEVVDPEMQMMQEMTEEEALKHLGLERIQIYKDLETILSKRMSWARKIVDYLMEITRSRCHY